MKKTLFVTILLAITCVFTQTHVETYSSLYSVAMEDSIITIEELSLLNALQASFGMEEDEVLRIQQKWRESETPESAIIRNQEGRWWIIYQNMLLGNGLYGNAIPYILDIEDEKVRGGMQFLLFAGGFYSTWMYTKNMDISYGRALSQNYGASLGIASVYPLIALVGFENWADMDPDGKITLTYMMVGAPIGIWQADRLYRKWNPTNGQTQMITGGSGLAGFNTWGLYSLITDIPDELNETWLRVGIPLTYAGTLAGGYYTHKYVMNKPYTRGDASFVSIGTIVGLLSWFELSFALNLEEYREIMLLGLATVNGYTYLSDRLIQNVDLTTGDAGLVALGSAAGYLTWVGIALLADLDYENDGARFIDVASVTAGFYFTYKAVSKRRIVTASNESRRFNLSFQPTVIHNADRLSPGLNMTLRF